MKTGKQNSNWIEKKTDEIIDQCLDIKLNTEHFQSTFDENIGSYFELPKFGKLDYFALIDTESKENFLQCLNEAFAVSGLIDLGISIEGIVDLSLQLKNVYNYHADDLSEFKYTLS